MTLITKYTTEL